MLLGLVLGADGHTRTTTLAFAPARGLPIAFTPGDDSLFTARGPSGTLFLRPDRASLGVGMPAKGKAKATALAAPPTMALLLP